MKVFMRHAFFVLLATCVLVLACLLISIIKHIEHSLQVYNVLPGSPHIRSMMSLVLKDCKVAFILLIVVIGIMGFFLFSYIFVMRSSGR
ncbi:hypothetical protein ACFX10_031320 [Malus domestica]|uniref:Uncharacterized protein n=1 Tax=Malus domestica TaxID=3750 RepID=A0A498K9M2_MALDO|nr:hypothetical protein DVH24_002593 [Malus domestica]